MSRTEVHRDDLEVELERLARNIARDLREIGHLCRGLRVEAWHRHSDRVLPGGDALVMLSPSAYSYEAYNAQVDRAEEIYYRGRAAGVQTRWPEIYDLDSDPTPPMLVLEGWTRIVREEREQPTGLPATLSRELAYLSGSLSWMTTLDAMGRPYFDAVEEFGRDMAQLRRRLEAVLHDGPDDQSVPCIRCTGEARGRLEPQWGDDPSGDDDQWWCRTCGALLSRRDYLHALVAAQRLTAVALSASDLLAEYGVSMATVRKWAERGHVRKHGRDASGRVTYDVDDVLSRMMMREGA